MVSGAKMDGSTGIGENLIFSFYMLIIPTELRLSPRHGLGLFCLEPLLPGQVVARFHPALDLLISPETFAQLPESFREAVEYYGFLDESSGIQIYNVDNSRFINHSETPNLKVGKRVLKARQAISPGEELTTDYRSFCDACHADLAATFAACRSFIDEASLQT